MKLQTIKLSAGVLLAVTIVSAWWSAAAATGSVQAATWGQILIIGLEPIKQRQPPFHGPYFAELYDPVSNRFAVRRPILHVPRTVPTVTVIPVGPRAGQVLVAGGVGIHVQPLRSSEIYNPATNTFARGPRKSGTREAYTATVIQTGPKSGWILLADGATILYDPFADALVPGPRPKHGHDFNTATTIVSGPNSGQILYAGGSPDRKTELYDPLTNRFTPGLSMNVDRESHTATVIPSGPNTGKILLAGGFDVAATRASSSSYVIALASTELYDPATNTFIPSSATARMNVARMVHTATVLTAGPNAGKILLVGGEGRDELPLSSTELYDATTNRFTLGPPLHSSRAFHVAMVIRRGPNAGKILIAGGESYRFNKRNECVRLFPSSTELYDPMTNRFALGPPMRGGPGVVRAVQLPSAPLPRSARR